MEQVLQNTFWHQQNTAGIWKDKKDLHVTSRIPYFKKKKEEEKEDVDGTCTPGGS